jgi:hypothetical protein
MSMLQTTISYLTLISLNFWLLPLADGFVFIKICVLVFFFIGGKPIENVSQYSHLDHIINSTLSFSDDITNRRNFFVGQANNVMCFFNKLDLTVKRRLFLSYCSSIYGSEV